MRFGAAVVRGEQCAGPAGPRALGQPAAQFVGIEQPRLGAERAGAAQPGLLVRQLARVLAGVADAGAHEAGVLAEARLPVVPQAQAGQRQRNLRQVAAHAAHPAPVARRLLGGDLALFQQGHRDAASGEGVGGAHADDAAADDRHIGAGG
ncbi:hypothetical protein D3C75_818290 [compost metagenome]